MNFIGKNRMMPFREEHIPKGAVTTDLERTGAELSQRRYLLECARQQEREGEERAQLARHTALTDAIEAAERRGYARGAEEMRERAALRLEREGRMFLAHLHPRVAPHARGADLTVQTFVIPEPPSVNNLFRNVPGKGRVKTERYNIWMQAAQWDVLLEDNKPRRIEKLTGPVEISIEMGKCRGDIDNRNKAVLDLMVKCGVIADDRQVQLLVIARDSDLKKRTVVTVRPFVRSAA